MCVSGFSVHGANLSAFSTGAVPHAPHARYPVSTPGRHGLALLDPLRGQHELVAVLADDHVVVGDAHLLREPGVGSDRRGQFGRRPSLEIGPADVADLSGNASKVEKAPVADREFANINSDTLDDYMASVQPGLALNVNNTLDPEAGGKLSVSLDFKKMADLSPGEVARQVPALATLLEARQQLANLQRYMNGKAGAQDQLKQLLADPKLMAALNERRAAAKGDAEE